MCNLYSLTKGQAAIRDWFRAGNDRTGNLPLFPGIFPDQMAPIGRNGAAGERELVMARWACRGPHNSGARRSPIAAISAALMGGVARQAYPLHRAVEFVLRVRRHQAAQDAEMV